MHTVKKRRRKIQHSRGDRVWSLLIGILLAVIVFITLYPFWHVIMYSLSDSRAAMRGGLFFFPREFSLLAYEMTFKTSMLFISFRNTILKTVIGTSLSLLVTILTAYPLSLRRFRGRNFFSFFIFFTMLFGGGMIPTYMLINSLGMIDTFWAYIIPGLMSPWNMFILRNYFQSIPESLDESARIDGANSFQILFRITIRVSLPAIAAITMFYFVANWNSYMDGVLYINSSNLQLLQVYLRQLIAATGGKGALGELANQADASTLTGETVKMTVIVISTVPILVIYPWLQKYYTKGVMVGSVKG